MQVEGEAEFDAPRDAVWKAVIHPDTLAATLPGVASVSVHDETHWSADVRVRLGKLPVRMRVAVEILDQREGEHARLHAHGRGIGGSLRVDTSFDLSDNETGTHMRWSADVALGGPGGRMGSQLLRPLVDRQVARLLETVRERASGAQGA
jgi:carbon monoxide dehydrogenase subunit G